MACGNGNKSKVDASPSPTRETVASVPATTNPDLDLLFVIDDSGSMGNKQTNFQAALPAFLDTLAAQYDGGLPNLRAGVVTTDMGTKGSAVMMPGPRIGAVGQGGCADAGKDGALQTFAAPVTDRFVEDRRDGSKNYTGELASVLGQLVTAGNKGCGFEQPLHAMQRALKSEVNAGFLRDHAMLAVVFLTDEDDCTFRDPHLIADDTTLGPLSSFRCTALGVTCAQGGETPNDMIVPGPKSACTAAASEYMDDVAAYRDALVEVKRDISKLVVAGIMGDPEPVEVELRTVDSEPQSALAHSCEYTSPTGPQIADPGVRLKTFFELFPNREHFEGICQNDLVPALTNIAATIARSNATPCLDAALVVPVDCIVEDVVGASTTEIPACASPETAPCWRLESDATRCPQLDHQKLVVVRAAPPDPSTLTKARCLVP
jgi:hypothetical protein